MTRATILQEVRQMRLEELMSGDNNGPSRWRRLQKSWGSPNGRSVAGVAGMTWKRRGGTGSAVRASLGPCGARG